MMLHHAIPFNINSLFFATGCLALGEYCGSNSHCCSNNCEMVYAFYGVCTSKHIIIRACISEHCNNGLEIIIFECVQCVLS